MLFGESEDKMSLVMSGHRGMGHNAKRGTH